MRVSPSAPINDAYHELLLASRELTRLAALRRATPTDQAEAARVAVAYAAQLDTVRLLSESLSNTARTSHESREETAILESALEALENELEERRSLPGDITLADEDYLLEMSMQEFERVQSIASSDGLVEPPSEDDAPTDAPNAPPVSDSVPIEPMYPQLSENIAPPRNVLLRSSQGNYKALQSLLSPKQPLTFADAIRLAGVAPQTHTVLQPTAVKLFVAEARRLLELTNGASAESQLTLLNRTKLNRDQIIEAAFTSTVFRPSYYVGVDDVLKCIVLGIRSTKSFSDLLTDYNYQPARFFNGWAHEGMCRAARWLDSHVSARLCVLREMYPGYRVRVLGHSLGAGVATLFGMLARRMDELCDIECVVFAPPCCVCPTLAHETHSFTTSVVNQEDILPYLAHQTQADVVRLLSPSAAIGAFFGVKPEPRAAASDSEQKLHHRAASAVKSTMLPFLQGDFAAVTANLASEFVSIQQSVAPEKPLYPQLSEAQLPPVASAPPLEDDSNQVAQQRDPTDQQHSLSSSSSLAVQPHGHRVTNSASAQESDLVVPGRIIHFTKNANGALQIEVNVPWKRFVKLESFSMAMVQLHRKKAYFEALDKLEKAATTH